jgi:LmbE family N-acetylglucosaminyl deacetylase
MPTNNLPESRATIIAHSLCRPDHGVSFGFPAVVIAGHPDDEIIGLGGRLHRFSRVAIVHVTDGAPSNMGDALAAGIPTRVDYARAREAEWSAAMHAGGIHPAGHVDLNVTDQTAGLQLPYLVTTLLDLLQSTRPEVVLTHPYEGGHPDHDATALAVHAALSLLARKGGLLPHLVEFTSYHLAEGRMAVGTFLPAEGCPPCTAQLSAEEIRRKEAMYACFATQAHVLKDFSTQAESYRAAPAYDFTMPPHPGRLYYEGFDWGMSAMLFCARAAEVMRLFDLKGPL